MDDHQLYKYDNKNRRCNMKTADSDSLTFNHHHCHNHRHRHYNLHHNHRQRSRPCICSHPSFLDRFTSIDPFTMIAAGASIAKNRNRNHYKKEDHSGSRRLHPYQVVNYALNFQTLILTVVIYIHVPKINCIKNFLVSSYDEKGFLPPS